MENDTDESELLISFFFFIIFVKIDVFLAVLIKYTCFFFFAFSFPPIFAILDLEILLPHFLYIPFPSMPLF